MIDLIPDDWRAVLSEAIARPSFGGLIEFLAAERARSDTQIYPPHAEIFAVLELASLADVRAVIVGQDPYVRPRQAHGLAFSVRDATQQPPSLKNILKEWASDLEQPSVPESGSLEAWARHGVLLLNTALTVQRGEPDSHRGKGWAPFTNDIIRAVSAKPDPVAFLLWGSHAEAKAQLIADRHVIIRASHPSPKSAAGFLGTRPFTRANTALVARGMPPIDWSLGNGG